MAQSLRREVLTAYKKILKVARTWEARSGNVADTLKERDYMKKETKAFFRNNKHLENKEEINKRLKEAEARIAIALHYGNPYPRPVNVAPKTFTKNIPLGPSVVQKHKKT